jgi:hypothetical protein
MTTEQRGRYATLMHSIISQAEAAIPRESPPRRQVEASRARSRASGLVLATPLVGVAALLPLLLDELLHTNGTQLSHNAQSDREHSVYFPQAGFLDNFRIADQRARMRGVAARPGSTVALVANESINQHFKSPAENFCRW